MPSKDTHTHTQTDHHHSGSNHTTTQITTLNLWRRVVISIPTGMRKTDPPPASPSISAYLRSVHCAPSSSIKLNIINPQATAPKIGSKRVTISKRNMKVIRRLSKNREQSRRKSINISFFFSFLRAKSNPLKYSNKYYRGGCVNRITYMRMKILEEKKKRMWSTWKRPHRGNVLPKCRYKIEFTFFTHSLFFIEAHLGENDVRKQFL